MSERENNHGCEAAVVECIDYRFRDQTDNLLHLKYEKKGKKFDLISIAGSTKDLNTISAQIEISKKLHNIKAVDLIHHENCGAYGSESTPERHAKDLEHAKEAIHNKYPELQINTYYLKLEEAFKKDGIVHVCESAIVECIDYRFRHYIDEWLFERYKEKGKKYDLISIAGSTKNLDFTSNQLDLSSKLHHIKVIDLIHHEDCGAYGNESSFERHSKDLLHAKDTIMQKHQNLTVNAYYLKLDGTFVEVK